MHGYSTLATDLNIYIYWRNLEIHGRCVWFFLAFRLSSHTPLNRKGEIIFLASLIPTLFLTICFIPEYWRTTRCRFSYQMVCTYLIHWPCSFLIAEAPCLFFSIFKEYFSALQSTFWYFLFHLLRTKSESRDTQYA